MKRTAGFVAAMMLITCQPAWATRMPIHDMAESPQYGPKVGGMLGRGILNITTCFVDLLVNIANETRNGPPIVGTLVGVGKGAGCTTLRALSGGVDLLTFWVPGFNGMPVSDSYNNCLAGLSDAESVAPEATPASEPAWQPTRTATPAPAPVQPKEERPVYTK